MTKNYSEEFKRQAVQMVLDGKAATRVARELDVTEWTIRCWKKDFPDGLGMESDKSGMDPAEELKLLKRKYQDLKMENAILKKFAAILSKDQFDGNSRS